MVRPSVAELILKHSTWRHSSNGQQRTLYGNGEADPYDPTLTISQGERRKLFIDGYGRMFHSGDRSRINFLTNAYNSIIEFKTTFKTNLTNLSIRLRSRIDLPNEPADNTNRFGGYAAVFFNNRVEYYRQNYIGNYTTMNPASTTYADAISANEEVWIRVFIYSVNTNTKSEIRVEMARPSLDKPYYEDVGTSQDPDSPASHILNWKLYRNESYSHIKLNGTAKDILYNDLRIWDLQDDYVYNPDEEDGR